MNEAHLVFYWLLVQRQSAEQRSIMRASPAERSQQFKQLRVGDWMSCSIPARDRDSEKD